MPSDGDAYSNMVSYVVNPGTYSFSEVVPTSWYLAAINCTDGSSTVNLPQRSVSISPKAGETITCTFVNQRRVNIQAKKYNDLNGDGLHQNDEPFMADWTIELYNATNSLITNKVTDSTGQVDFLLRPPGTYKICEVEKSGWMNTAPGIPDEVLSKPCYTFLLPPGMGVNILFGNQQDTQLRANSGDESINVQYFMLPDVNDTNTIDPEEFLAIKSIFLPMVAR